MNNYGGDCEYTLAPEPYEPLQHLWVWWGFALIKKPGLHRAPGLFQLADRLPGFLRIVAHSDLQCRATGFEV